MDDITGKINKINLSTKKISKINLKICSKKPKKYLSKFHEPLESSALVENLESFGVFSKHKSKTQSSDKKFVDDILYTENGNVTNDSRRHNLKISDKKVVIVRTIGRTLNEPKVPLIDKIYDVIGVAKLLYFFQETLEILEIGGTKKKNSNEYRSPGGILFTLIRNSDQISKQQNVDIFQYDRKHQQRRLRMKKSTNNKKM